MNISTKFTRQYLAADSWLSAREASNLLDTCIRWGSYQHHNLRHASSSAIGQMLTSNGYDSAAVIKNLQANPHYFIPEFENAADTSGGSVSISGGGASTIRVKVARYIGDVKLGEVECDGSESVVSRVPYESDFSAACSARDSAIANSDFDAFYTCLSKGFSSLEGFMNDMVAVFNHRASDAEKLIERRPRGGYVPFAEKIREWMPKMAPNLIIDLDNSSGWKDFLTLRDLRNDVVIHPKPGSGLATAKQLADAINKFRDGLARLLLILHQAFELVIPSKVIRASLYPTVRVVDA